MKISGRQNSAFAGRSTSPGAMPTIVRGAAVEPDFRADGAGAPAELAPPQPLADHDDVAVACALGFDEPASLAHRHAEDVEVVPRYARAVDARRLARPVRLEVTGVKAAAS